MLNVAHKRQPDSPRPRDPDLYSSTRPAERARWERWLEDRIRRSQHAIIPEVVELTPVLAELLMLRNESNRNQSETTIQKYQRDVENGSWPVTGETIAVSRCGKLNDGQTRCEAVIRAGRSIEAIIVFGVTRESRLASDQGRTRTIAHYLDMQEIKNSTVIGAAANLVWQYDRRGTVSTQTKYRPTKTESQSLIEDNPRLQDSVNAVPQKGAYSFGGRSFLVFVHYVLARSSSLKEASKFIDRLMLGLHLDDPRDPVLVARNRLLNERGLSVGAKAELLFKAWNRYRKGERVASLQINGGRLPELEG